jgi:thiol-disulfide isomerase/thioredoxin
MNAVARIGSWFLWPGLLLSLFLPFGSVRAVTAVVGEPVPPVALPALSPDVEVISLADYRGRVVYLDFWSAWCAPCRHSMPQLDALRRAHSREDFEVIGVNVDSEAAAARRYLDRTPVSYPLARDPAGRIAAAFGVQALPALVVIDRDGVMRRTLVGAAVKAPGELRATLEQLLQEGEVQ